MINSSERNDVPVVLEPNSPSLDSLPTEEFLKVIGLRVRSQRSSMSMSRKRLAEVSGVSERYLAQLESGQGNMSIALLRKVTTAIGMTLATLLAAETPEMANASVTTPDNVYSGVNRQAPVPGSINTTTRSTDEPSQSAGRLVSEPEL